MVELIFKILGIKIKFTEKDEFYKNLKLSDYNIDKLDSADTLLSDNNLKYIFIFEQDIPSNIYRKFEEKHFWLLVMKSAKKYIYSLIIMSICLLSLIIFKNIFSVTIFILSFIISLYLKYRVKYYSKAYMYGLSFLDWQEKLKTDENSDL